MIQKTIADEELVSHLSSIHEDYRDIFLLSDNMRITFVSAASLVNKMRANHGTGIMETYVLGQGYIAGALLSSTIKGLDRIQLNIECGGPIKGMSVEAWASGLVRGYLQANPIELGEAPESFDTSLLYGPGFLSVTKISEGSRTPFTGNIMLEYGNLANDLALYYTESEQTPTVFYLSVFFDKKGRVWGAGGILIQSLPGCPDSTLEDVEKTAKSMDNLGKDIGSGISSEEYLSKYFPSGNLKKLSRIPVSFYCPCSREGFSSHLKALPESEKKAISEGEFPLVLECLNCSSEYSFSRSETIQLFNEANK